MSGCSGNGRCFIKCDCFGLYTLPPTDILVDCQCAYSQCVDRAHEKFGFRKVDPTCGCVLQGCKYYKHCGERCPQWVLDGYGGCDINCGMGNTMFHAQEFLDVIEECPICYDEKFMIAFGCKHKLCFECMWGVYSKQMDNNEHNILHETGVETGDVLCPLCRDVISVLRQEE